MASSRALLYKTMGIQTFLIVCPLVFLAGFVDAIAGGGGLISLPAYMFAGVPVHNAIATNKLSSCTGTVVSTWRLIKNKRVDWYFVPGTVVCALAGSVIGANLALIISDEILKTVDLQVPGLPDRCKGDFNSGSAFKI